MKIYAITRNYPLFSQGFFENAYRGRVRYFYGILNLNIHTMKKINKKETLTILTKTALLKIKGGNDDDGVIMEDVGGL